MDLSILELALITSAAHRLTKLWTDDDFPPVKWLRKKYLSLVKGTVWVDLASCAWCAGFWIAAGTFGLYLLLPEIAFLYVVLAMSSVIGLIEDVVT